MITKAIKLQTSLNVSVKVKYLISGHSEESNRVLLVEFDEDTFIDIFQSPAVIAEQFSQEMYDFTLDARGNKEMSAMLAQDISTSFSIRDNAMLTPQLAVDIVKEQVKIVMRK